MSKSVGKSRKVSKSVNDNTEFIYCNTRKCPYEYCLRRLVNAPFEKLVSVHRYILDKDGKCDGLLEE